MVRLQIMRFERKQVEGLRTVILSASLVSLYAVRVKTLHDLRCSCTR